MDLVFFKISIQSLCLLVLNLIHNYWYSKTYFCHFVNCSVLSIIFSLFSLAVVFFFLNWYFFCVCNLCRYLLQSYPGIYIKYIYKSIISLPLHFHIKTFTPPPTIYSYCHHLYVFILYRRMLYFAKCSFLHLLKWWWVLALYPSNMV